MKVNLLYAFDEYSSPKQCWNEWTSDVSVDHRLLTVSIFCKPRYFVTYGILLLSMEITIAIKWEMAENGGR